MGGSGEDWVWVPNIEEYIWSYWEDSIDLKALHAAEGNAIEIYGRLSDGASSYQVEYWIGTDTPVSFWVNSTEYTLVASISTSGDNVLGGDLTPTINFRTVGYPDHTASLQPTVFEDERLVTFDAAVHSATEGDDVLLTIASNNPGLLEYRVEDVSAWQPGKYSGATGWTAVGELGQVAFPTYFTPAYNGLLSFKIVVRVAGDASSEVVLEADIYDLVDTTIQSVEYAYDTFNQLVRRTHDADGSVGPGTATERFFSHEGGQIALQFDGPAAADLSNRYLWNPVAVDQLLADEQVTSLSAAGNVLWAFTDHLGTVRDLATHDDVTHATTIANHRQYDSFGNLISETNAAIDELFGFTGRLWDEATRLQNNLNRWYDPSTGRWLSEDPIGFLGGDTNLSRYVSNNPLSFVDPSGLINALPGPYVPETSSRDILKKGLVWDVDEDGAVVQRPATSLEYTGALIDATLDNPLDVTPMSAVGKGAQAACKVASAAAKASKAAKAASAAKSVAGKYDDLVKQAKKQYPNLAGKTQQHHITPKYVGGAANGPKVPLDGAYHQTITNAFRREHGYGLPKPSLERLREIMETVYDQCPLPKSRKK